MGVQYHIADFFCEFRVAQFVVTPWVFFWVVVAKNILRTICHLDLPCLLGAGTLVQIRWVVRCSVFESIKKTKGYRYLVGYVDMVVSAKARVLLGKPRFLRESCLTLGLGTLVAHHESC